MSVVQYITRAGDTADSIAFEYYGLADGTTEALLVANPGLANYDVLPAGLTIILPPAPATAMATTVKLWN